MTGTWAEVFLIAAISAFVFTYLARLISVRLGIFDRPDARKLQAAPVPLLGGVGIFAGFLIGILFNFEPSPALKGFALAGALVFVVGVIDDISGLPVFFRLLFQVLAGLVLLHIGVKIRFLPSSIMMSSIPC